ncbi:hypothetical protein DFH08DRAFT_826354 [Mycena albidolilacea]|uniref:Uncharacterized protein n=1 Tax=Mycena albidolilacea TaxID=1033008 RepID=A0AAD7E927_9AGAR|nr:hypothetical protein DFH08DRAFT_826354 [Mycena albidolilacea]
MMMLKPNAEGCGWVAERDKWQADIPPLLSRLTMFSASTSAAPLSASLLLKHNPLSALHAQMGTIVTSEITPRIFVADWLVAQNWDALDALGVTLMLTFLRVAPLSRISSSTIRTRIQTPNFSVGRPSRFPPSDSISVVVNDALKRKGSEVIEAEKPSKRVNLVPRKERKGGRIAASKRARETTKKPAKRAKKTP